MLKEKLILKDFRYFGGKHCWTTSLKNALAYHGLDLSEEMLFGLGGGLGFIYWYMKMMPVPFIGGRYGKGTDPLIDTLRRIGGEAMIFETNSAEKGYEELKRALREREPAIVFVDMVYLPYMVLPEIAHFGAHTIVVYGLDEEKGKVYVSDRSERPLTVTIDDLRRARSSKFPPFPPRNKLLRIRYPSTIGSLENEVRESIRESCWNMLKPPIKNIGLAGMQKWASLVIKWPEQFKGMNLFGCLFNLFIYIEIGGTGGSAFRPMYAQFLEEASSILNEPALRDVATMFRESGEVWSEIASAALPDSWPTLKRIRELVVEKNRIFEEQGPGALERMREISEEIDEQLISKKVAEEFEGLVEEDIALILAGLQQKILECYEIEDKAFRALSEVIT